MSALKTAGSVAGSIVKNSTFQIVVGILAILGFVYYVGTKMGQKVIPTVDYPNKGAGLPEGWQKQAEELLNKCHDAVYGYLVSAQGKEQVFIALLSLSDDQLVYMYNSFNAKYFREHDETLTAAIDNELIYLYTTGTKSQLINRMRGLKLA